MSTPAPFANSNSATPWRPLRAAACNGVPLPRNGSPGALRKTFGVNGMEWLERNMNMECQIMFSRSPAGPCVPWTLVYYDFCSMFPRSGLASQYPTLHRAVCAFRSPSAQVLKCGGCKVITAPNCTHFQPLGLGKVVEFFGSFCPRSEGACWFGVLTHDLDGSSHKISPSMFTWYLPWFQYLMCRSSLGYPRGAWAWRKQLKQKMGKD